MADRNDLSALFVRIPQDQARALDRLAFESGRSKQAIVSDLLASSMHAQPAVGGAQPAVAGEHRTAGEDRTDRIGWHSFRAFENDVLTLEGVAELLAVEPEVVAELAASGELPGRQIGGAWRFARAAVLDWLATPHAPRANRVGDRSSSDAPSPAETGD
jgi:excisionase family DNA binding protein